MNERLPRGVRKHFRNELADIRDSGSPIEIKRVEEDVATIRLSFHYSPQLEELREEIEKYPIDSIERVELNIKRFWIEYRISDPTIRPAKVKEINSYLTSVENNYPKIYADLFRIVAKDAKDNAVTRIIEIRNQVIPPEEFNKR